MRGIRNPASASREEFGTPAYAVAVSFYGPTDLPYAYAHPTNPKVTNIRRLLEDYLGGSPEVGEEGYRKASSVNLANPCSYLTLFVQSSRDDMAQAPQRTPRQSTRGVLGVAPLCPAPVGDPSFDRNLRGQVGG